MTKGILRIRLERVVIPPPITKNFERHLLLRQVAGETMLSFAYDGGGSFLIYFGGVERVDAKTGDVLEVVVAPWKLYVFNPSRREINPGDLFCSVRLIEDYYDFMDVGDPVELVDITSNVVLGTADIVALHKSRVEFLQAPVVTAAHQQGCLDDYKSIIEHLEEEYEQPVLPTDTVLSLHLRATSKISIDQNTKP